MNSSEFLKEDHRLVLAILIALLLALQQLAFFGSPGAGILNYSLRISSFNHQYFCLIFMDVEEIGIMT